MARIKDRETAIALRKKGLSYSQIKHELKVSKSTLSNWLHEMPLTKERMKELRDNSQVRIEKTRETKRKKKEIRQREVYAKVAKDIQKSKNVNFVSGFYLYWGEGTKTADYTVSLTNSDPAMTRAFVDWMELLGVSRDRIKIKLHLYTDQNEQKLKDFWSKITGVPRSNFNKTYKKTSAMAHKTYKGMFPYGTCVLMYHDRDMHEYVIAGVRYLRSKHGFAE